MGEALRSCLTCDIFRCSEFYKYVLNSMSCYYQCGSCSCGCTTSEVEQPATDDTAVIALKAFEIICDSTKLTHYSSSQGTINRADSDDSVTKLDL